MNVKAFISIANRSLQNTLAYRTSYILTFASNFIGFIATYALWHAISNKPEQLAALMGANEGISANYFHNERPSLLVL